MPLAWTPQPKRVDRLTGIVSGGTNPNTQAPTATAVTPNANWDPSPAANMVYNVGGKAYTQNTYNDLIRGQQEAAQKAQATALAQQQQQYAQQAAAQQAAWTKSLADQQSAATRANQQAQAQYNAQVAQQQAASAQAAQAYAAQQQAIVAQQKSWSQFSGTVAQTAYTPAVQAASAQPDPAIAQQQAAAAQKAKDDKWAQDDAASKAQQAKNFKTITSNTSWQSGRSEQDVTNYRQYQEQFYSSLLNPTPDQAGITRGGAGPLRG